VRPLRVWVLSLIALAASCSAGTNKSITLGQHDSFGGTFTDIRVIDNKGVFGTEIRILPGHEPPIQALVQFAFGDFCDPRDHGEASCFGVSNTLVVPLLIEPMHTEPYGTAVSFDLPGDSSYSGSFDGVVAEDRLRGAFSFTDGTQLEVDLQRGISFWDQ